VSITYNVQLALGTYPQSQARKELRGIFGGLSGIVRGKQLRKWEFHTKRIAPKGTKNN